MSEWGKKITRQELVDLCKAFIEAIPESSFFKEKAQNTKKQYRIAASNILRSFERIPYRLEITPQIAQAIVDNVAETCGSGAAKAAKAVTGPMWRFMTLYTEFDCLHSNPFKYVVVPETGHIEAWTEELCEYVIALYDGRKNRWYKTDLFVSTMAMLLYETAQRLGDAVKITPRDCHIKTIRIEQEKTGANVLVPVSERLRLRMNLLESSSSTRPALYTAAWADFAFDCNGKGPDSFKPDVARYLFTKRLRALGIDAPPLHGIRKAAINRMIKAGATEYEIMGVTGHKQSSTVSMYAKDFDRSQAAARAMEKVEAAGK